MKKRNAPEYERPRVRHALFKRRVEEIAMDAVEALAQRLEKMKTSDDTKPGELADVAERMVDISLTIAWSTKLQTAIKRNPANLQHAPSGKLLKKLGSWASRTRKAEAADGRTGAEKDRRRKAEELFPDMPPQE